MSGLLDAPDAAVDLKEQLARGVGAFGTAELRHALGVDEQAEDKTVARALVRAVAKESASGIQLASWRRVDPRQSEDISRVCSLQPSYLGRLTAGTAERRLDLKRFDDTHTLLAVLRAGTLSQRRAAVRRLGELVEQRRELPSDRLQEVMETLTYLRDVEIAHELAAARERLPGVAGRRARALRREWDRLASEVERRVVVFWDGVGSEEPVAALNDDERAQLFSHVPDLPEPVVRHLSAVVENVDGVTDRAGRRALVSWLRYAGDPRLVPSWRALLEGREPELVIPVLRALGHVEEPRVHGILRAAYERLVSSEQRIAAAGALGVAGDARGAAYVRDALQEKDPSTAALALEALASLGSADDFQAVSEFLEQSDLMLLTAAMKTLARIGESRALVPLQRLRQRVRSSALRAEVEEAEAAIYARLELLGEEAPPSKEASEAFDTAKMAVLVTRRASPVRVGFRTRWSLFLGQLWLLFGSLGNAVARFEAAASMRPGWAAPVLAVALAYSGRQQHAQALGAFRRALEIDRVAVEQNPTSVRALARSFLLRAEEVERQGRSDVAQGLVEEVLAVDLRKAPSGLRFALHQRLEALRRREP